MPQAVFSATIFDFNGVLVDDEPVHLEAFREALAPRGITVTDQAYLERYFGFDDAGAFRAMIADAGQSASDADIAALVDAKRPLYMRRVEQALRIFPGAADVVRRCAAAGPVAIVSGAPRDEIVHALRLMGVENHVQFIVSAEDTTRCKPDPEGYEIAIARLTGKPRGRMHALVIEDSLHGVEAAKHAHLSCLAVAHSYPEADLYASGADLVIGHIGDLSNEVIAAVERRALASNEK